MEELKQHTTTAVIYREHEIMLTLSRVKNLETIIVTYNAQSQRTEKTKRHYHKQEMRDCRCKRNKLK